MSADGQNGAIVALPAGGASVVARSLAGGASVVARSLAGGPGAPLWLKLNLTGHDRVQGAGLVRRVMYTAGCGGPPGR